MTIGTKFKWISESNLETYRVAIKTKNGILQVKSLTDGGAECDRSHTVGGVYPLLKTFFQDETAWRNSLPAEEGQVVITSPPLTKKALKMLCMKPLEATTDAFKLKELEERFPYGVFVLSKAPTEQYEIYYARIGAKDRICSLGDRMSSFYCDFSAYGITGKPRLMVEWKGLYIDLSHLF
jgi:hypothetical protein